MRTTPVRWVTALVMASMFILTSCVMGGGAFDRESMPITKATSTPAKPTVSSAKNSQAAGTPDPRPSPVDVGASPSNPQVSTLAPTPTVEPALPDGCDAPDELSQPQEMRAGSTGARSVVRLPRENGASPVPPNFARDIYAWDNQGGEIGYDQYKAYFTAHTYSSDETALGNILQAQVFEGDTVHVVDTKGKTICYQINERIEVQESEYIEAVTSRPSEGVLVISVCSGLEGREWTKRTIWFAQLVQPARMK